PAEPALPAGRREGAPPPLAVLAPRATRKSGVPPQLHAGGSCGLPSAAPLPALHDEGASSDAIVARRAARGPWRRSSAGRLPGPLTVDALQEQIGCRLLHPAHARIPEQRRTQISLQRRREKEGA